MSAVLEKHWPMRAVYLAMQRMCRKSPMPARISAALGPPRGADQNHAACSRTCAGQRILYRRGQRAWSLCVHAVWSGALACIGTLT